MFDLIQDINVCIKGMELYITHHKASASEGAKIVKRWLEHIKFAT